MAVGHMPIIQDLQQNVEHVCMRRFYLIKQNDCIGLPPAASRTAKQESCSVLDDYPQAKKGLADCLFKHTHSKMHVNIACVPMHAQ